MESNLIISNVDIISMDVVLKKLGMLRQKFPLALSPPRFEKVKNSKPCK